MARRPAAAHSASSPTCLCHHPAGRRLRPLLPGSRQGFVLGVARLLERSTAEPAGGPCCSSTLAPLARLGQPVRERRIARPPADLAEPPSHPQTKHRGSSIEAGSRCRLSFSINRHVRCSASRGPRLHVAPDNVHAAAPLAFQPSSDHLAVEVRSHYQRYTLADDFCWYGAPLLRRQLSSRPEPFDLRRRPPDAISLPESHTAVRLGAFATSTRPLPPSSAHRAVPSTRLDTPIEDVPVRLQEALRVRLSIHSPPAGSRRGRCRSTNFGRPRSSSNRPLGGISSRTDRSSR